MHADTMKVTIVLSSFCPRPSLTPHLTLTFSGDVLRLETSLVTRGIKPRRPNLARKSSPAVAPAAAHAQSLEKWAARMRSGETTEEPTTTDLPDNSDQIGTYQNLYNPWTQK